MNGTIHLVIRSPRNISVRSDPQEMRGESKGDVRDGMAQLTAMIKDPKLTHLAVQVEGITRIVLAKDIGSVSVCGSTKELNDLIWKVS